MKIIRLEPEQAYDPFPYHVIVVSKFPFLPKIAATWRYYTLDGKKWTLADAVKRKTVMLPDALLMIAEPDHFIPGESYKTRTYTFEYNGYHQRFELR